MEPFWQSGEKRRHELPCPTLAEKLKRKWWTVTIRSREAGGDFGHVARCGAQALRVIMAEAGSASSREVERSGAGVPFKDEAGPATTTASYHPQVKTPQGFR